MSNNPPNINPTGTRLTRIPVFPTFYDGYATEREKKNPFDYTKHTKPFTALLKIMGEYIRADYVVRYSETTADGQTYADMIAEPPLFAGMNP